MAAPARGGACVEAGRARQAFQPWPRTLMAAAVPTWTFGHGRARSRWREAAAVLALLAMAVLARGGAHVATWWRPRPGQPDVPVRACCWGNSEMTHGGSPQWHVKLK